MTLETVVLLWEVLVRGVSWKGIHKASCSRHWTEKL